MIKIKNVIYQKKDNIKEYIKPIIVQTIHNVSFLQFGPLNSCFYENMTNRRLQTI